MCKLKWSIQDKCLKNINNLIMNFCAQGSSLAAQWLALCEFTAQGPGSNSGWETKILQATQSSKKKKKKVPSILPYIIVLHCFSSKPSKSLNIFKKN